jgi:hypothetical protein
MVAVHWLRFFWRDQWIRVSEETARDWALSPWASMTEFRTTFEWSFDDIVHSWQVRDLWSQAQGTQRRQYPRALQVGASE